MIIGYVKKGNSLSSLSSLNLHCKLSATLSTTQPTVGAAGRYLAGNCSVVPALPPKSTRASRLLGYSAISLFRALKPQNPKSRQPIVVHLQLAGPLSCWTVFSAVHSTPG